MKHRYLVVAIGLCTLIFSSARLSAGQMLLVRRHESNLKLKLQSVSDRIDAEKAKRLALNAARSYSDIDFRPEFVSEAPKVYPHFEQYRFLYVWGPLRHTENMPVAVSSEGKVFRLPAEFNRLTKHRGLLIERSEDAKALVRFYLDFDVVWPGADSQRILSTVEDIPGIKSHVDSFLKYQTVIKPLQVSRSDRHWVLTFYTWRAVDGLLYDWRMKVSRTAGIEVERTIVLDRGIGHYLVPE